MKTDRRKRRSMRVVKLPCIFSCPYHTISLYKEHIINVIVEILTKIHLIGSFIFYFFSVQAKIKEY